MRALIEVLLIVYLIGVGVALTPAFAAEWNSVPASQFATDLARDLPQALAWPQAAYRRFTESAS